jgi:hypothetical protein
MLQVRRVYRIATSTGMEIVGRERFDDEAAAKERAAESNREVGAHAGYYRAIECFVLEVQQEQGPSLFFDLGAPVVVR